MLTSFWKLCSPQILTAVPSNKYTARQGCVMAGTCEVDGVDQLIQRERFYGGQRRVAQRVG